MPFNTLTRLPATTAIVTPAYEIKRWHPAVTTTVTTYTAVTLGTGVLVSGNTETSFGSVVVSTPTGTVLFPAAIDPSTLVGTTTTVTTPGYYTTELVPETTTLVLVPQPGWVGSAVSGESFYLGTFSFLVDPSAKGVVCGLNYAFRAGINSGYTDIPFAFFCSRGKWQIVEKGVLKTSPVAFTATTEFQIDSTSTGIHYYVNGAKVYEGGFSTGFELQADTSLYLTGDAIYNAVMVSMDPAPIVLHPDATLSGTGGITATPRPTAELASTGAVSVGFYAQNLDNYALPIELSGEGSLIHNEQYAEPIELAGAASISASGRFISALSGSLPAFTATIIDGLNFAEINSVFPSLESNMGDSALPVDYAGIYGFFGGLFSDIYVSSGQIGSIDSSFGNLSAVLGNGSHAEIRGTLSSLSIYAGEFARVEDYSGVCAVFGNGYSGSGTLLWNGQAILTVAHLAEKFVANPYDINLLFKTTLDLPRYWVDKVILHPNYTNNGAGVVTNDLAILVLQTPVDGRIARYDVNSDPIEKGAVFTRYGYSPRTSPMTGVIEAPVTWEWHYVTNIYEAFASYDTTAQIMLSSSVGEFLAYDYDNGTVQRDVLGGAMNIHNLGVPNEGGLRPGDSGSAGFVNGKIAGVATAFASAQPYDVNAVADGTYGELDLDTRMYSYNAWLRSVLATVFVTQTASFDGRLSFGMRITGTFIPPSYALLDMPEFTFSGFSGASLESTASSFTGAITGTWIELGEAGLPLTTFTLSATGRLIGSGVGALQAPMAWVVTAAGGARATDLVLPAFSLNGNGVNPYLGHAALHLPTWSFSATGKEVVVGHAELALFTPRLMWETAAMTFGGFTLAGTGSAGLNNSVAYTMNIVTNESTRYTNYPFMHIITIGGRPYGVAADGLYLLEGTTDNGLNISASVTTKQFDFESYHSKSISMLYLASDTLTSTTAIVDDVAMPANPSSFNGRRVKLSRGAKGRYWQFKIDNIVGLYGLELQPDELSRRIK